MPQVSGDQDLVGRTDDVHRRQAATKIMRYYQSIHHSQGSSCDIPQLDRTFLHAQVYEDDPNKQNGNLNSLLKPISDRREGSATGRCTANLSGSEGRRKFDPQVAERGSIMSFGGCQCVWHANKFAGMASTAKARKYLSRAT